MKNYPNNINLAGQKVQKSSILFENNVTSLCKGSLNSSCVTKMSVIRREELSDSLSEKRLNRKHTTVNNYNNQEVLLIGSSIGFTYLKLS